MRFIRTVLVLVSAVVSLHADVASVKAEPNLEKRSQLALDHAEQEIAAAKKAYSAGQFEDFKRLLTEVADLADVCYGALEDTGKRARRAPKWFKKAEQKLLTIIRRIGSLEKDVAIEDRDLVKDVGKRVSDVHDRLLNDIMTKK
jgi:hypothetical protein